MADFDFWSRGLGSWDNFEDVTACNHGRHAPAKSCWHRVIVQPFCVSWAKREPFVFVRGMPFLQIPINIYVSHPSYLVNIPHVKPISFGCVFATNALKKSLKLEATWLRNLSFYCYPWRLLVPRFLYYIWAKKMAHTCKKAVHSSW